MRQLKLRKWGLLSGLLITTLITLYLLSELDRFYVVDQQVLLDPQFLQEGLHWHQKNSSLISYEGLTVHIDNSEEVSDEIKQQLSVDSPVYVRFSLEAGGTEIEPSDKYWAGGSATVFLYRNDGTVIRHNKILTLKQSSPMQQYSGVFFLDKSVASVSVALRLLRAKGRFSVRNPELAILAEFPSYKKTRIALMSYWWGVGLALLFFLFRFLSVKRFLLSFGLVTIAIIGVLVPGKLISDLNNRIFDLLPPIAANGIEKLQFVVVSVHESSNPSASISKFGHILVFTSIGMFIGQMFRKLGVAYGVLLIATFAGITETLQLFVPGRSTSLRDVYIDFCGGVIGLLIGVGCVLLVERLSGQARPNV